MLENLFIPVGHAQIPHVDDLVPRGLRASKMEVDGGRVLLRRHQPLLQPLDLLLLGGDGHIIPFLVPATLLGDDAFDPLYLLHGLLIPASRDLPLVHLQLHMPGIVAPRGDQMAVLQLQHPVHRGVQKRTVVGNQHVGPFIGAQILLQVADGGHVQVVGGLVQ